MPMMSLTVPLPPIPGSSKRGADHPLPRRHSFTWCGHAQMVGDLLAEPRMRSLSISHQPAHLDVDVSLRLPVMLPTTIDSLAVVFPGGDMAPRSIYRLALCSPQKSCLSITPFFSSYSLAQKVGPCSFLCLSRFYCHCTISFLITARAT